jgi:aminoglycoside phosphotransferase (APT) family kinase protein
MSEPAKRPAEASLAPSDPPGLDLTRLADYLREAQPGLLHGQLSAELIAGGKSNLTYRVRDADRSIVLRRPPLGHVLPTAHDMAREYRVISALHPTGFPVATPIHLCPDAEPLGAPFYLMSYVEGRVLRETADIEGLSPDTARRTGELLVDTLVQLHATDPEKVGLTDFGRPAGYLARQVRRWYEQWERSKTRELQSLEDVAARLRESVPEHTRTGIVHGDFRLDNVIVDAAVSQILAVLDWEMATLGDPLADLGLLVVYTELAADGLAPTQPRLSPDQGFMPAAALVERYGDQAGVDVGAIGWHVALGYYKLAIVSEGIHARFLQGKTVGAGFEHMGSSVPLLIDRARTHLDTDHLAPQ